MLVACACGFCCRVIFAGQVPFVAGLPLAAEGDGVYAGTVKTRG